MNVNPSSLAGSLVFKLGTLGAVATARFTAALDERGLKPKHAGLLAALSAGAPPSQLELARAMGVAPSLVVSLADQLEAIGAVRRVRDPADRRRQVLELTTAGRDLLAECGALAHDLDAELAAVLPAAELAALHRALSVLAREVGLPVE